jgi:hypothetical protein
VVRVLVSVLVSGICYSNLEIKGEVEEGRSTMEKLSYLWIRYGKAQNLKTLYILLSLIALAVASGAPGAGGGLGGS